MLTTVLVVSKASASDARRIKLACMPSKSPPAALMALDGRSLDSLDAAELLVLQRYRNGRRRHGSPWISIGFKTDFIDPWAWLRTRNQAEADQMLKTTGAIVCVLIYE